jgi:hypothetical protein
VILKDVEVEKVGAYTHVEPVLLRKCGGCVLYAGRRIGLVMYRSLISRIVEPHEDQENNAIARKAEIQPNVKIYSPLRPCTDLEFNVPRAIC